LMERFRSVIVLDLCKLRGIDQDHREVTLVPELPRQAGEAFVVGRDLGVHARLSNRLNQNRLRHYIRPQTGRLAWAASGQIDAEGREAGPESQRKGHPARGLGEE